MKLDLILQHKDAYKKALMKGSASPDSLFRLCILKWQQHFNLEEMRLASTLQYSLKNKISGRYWGGEKHSIKSGLIMLADANPDLFWEAIKDLLNEDRMLIMKVDRFLHHCNVILQDLRKSQLKINTHHQSPYSASLLLSLQHPSNYCLFDYAIFEKYCGKIGVNDIPASGDLERYYKIVRAVYKIVCKDEELMNTYYSKLEEGVFYGPSLMMVYDLMRFVE